MTTTADTTGAGSTIADDPIPDNEAQTRIVRLFGIFVGSSYLVYLAILSPSIVSNTDLVAGWWTVPAVAAVFGPPVVLLAASIVRRRDLARMAAVTSAVGYLAAGLTWLIAPRLVVRTRSAGSVVFHAAERPVIAACARISLGLPPLE